MTNEQIIWNAATRVEMIARFAQPHFDKVVRLASAQTCEVERLQDVIDEQQEQIALLRDRVKRLNGVLFLLSVLVEKV